VEQAIEQRPGDDGGDLSRASTCSALVKAPSRYIMNKLQEHWSRSRCLHLVKATDVLGSQVEVERWLDRPTIGLDQRRPIDLLCTPAGIELLEEHLERLECGVYA
jgi:hypothetical protein